MEVIVNGQVMEVVSKEYDFDGSKGISHKVMIYSDSKLYQVVIPVEQKEYFNSLIGENVTLSCKIFIKGTYNLRLNNE